MRWLTYSFRALMCLGHQSQVHIDLEQHHCYYFEFLCLKKLRHHHRQNRVHQVRSLQTNPENFKGIVQSLTGGFHLSIMMAPGLMLLLLEHFFFRRKAFFLAHEYSCLFFFGLLSEGSGSPSWFVTVGCSGVWYD